MAVEARTWVEGELVNAAKMNTLRDDILELDAVAGISSVQYGSVTVTNGNTTGTATISAVDTAKAIVFFLGDNPAVDATRSARITLTNATTVTATKGNSSDSVVANFCVLEYN